MNALLIVYQPIRCLVFVSPKTLERRYAHLKRKPQASQTLRICQSFRTNTKFCSFIRAVRAMQLSMRPWTLHLYYLSHKNQSTFRGGSLKSQKNLKISKNSQNSQKFSKTHKISIKSHEVKKKLKIFVGFAIEIERERNCL